MDAGNMQYDVLVDEKIGDVTGDGIRDRVCLVGDKMADSAYIHNITIDVYYGNSQTGWQNITEVSGYNPSIFLGDFTKNRVQDILFSLDIKYDNLIRRKKGEYGASLYTYIEESFDIIFESDRYNMEYRFFTEFTNFYKVNILSVSMNKLFTLDISYKGIEYLSRYYDKNGKLIKPVQGRVFDAGTIIPVVSNLADNFFDLRAVHAIIGTSDNDILGYVENLLSWNGTQFISISMTVSTPGTYLIPPENSV